MDKQQLKERESKITEMAVEFCNQKLNDECASLCTKLIQKLEIWAAASVYTICSVNFMFAKSSSLYIPSTAISDYFGTSNSTVSQKSRAIKEMLKISNFFDANFTLQEIAAKNPFLNLRMENGFFFLG